MRVLSLGPGWKSIALLLAVLVFAGLLLAGAPAFASSGGTLDGAATVAAQVSGPSVFSRLVNQLGNGILLGTIIAITSIGLSLIFGVTRVVNFAHGELVTLGAVTALVFAQPGGSEPFGLGLPFTVSVGLAVAVGALVGGVLELTLFRPLRHRGVGASPP